MDNNMSKMPNKKICIIGGGTNTYISNHLALSAPAYGTTAITLEDKFRKHPENKMQVDHINSDTTLHLNLIQFNENY